MEPDTNTAATSALTSVASGLVSLFSGLATTLGALTATWPRVVGMGMTLLFILAYTGKLSMPVLLTNADPQPNADLTVVESSLAFIETKTSDIKASLDTLRTGLDDAKRELHNSIIAEGGELGRQLESLKSASNPPRLLKKPTAKPAAVAMPGLPPILP